MSDQSPDKKHCPTCESPDPKKHPAVQFEGEIQLCRDPWHDPNADQIEASFSAPSAIACGATPSSYGGGASCEQRWHCDECGDVTDTTACPKGRVNEAVSKLASPSHVEPSKADGTDYKALWERDSTALGKSLQEVHNLRAVSEDRRAKIVGLERDLSDERARRSSVALLTDWLRENAPDCGDNSCLFGGRGKGGMRTNGGCRCFKDLPTAKRIYVERLFAAISGTPSAMAARTTAEAVIGLKNGAEALRKYGMDITANGVERAAGTLERIAAATESANG